MKIIDDLLKASNGYICGVETSKEYKKLATKLKQGEENKVLVDKLRKAIIGDTCFQAAWDILIESERKDR